MPSTSEPLAGPALDELVATSVMGWQRLADSIDGIVVHRLYRSPAGQETSWVPSFSTNIAFAWEVADRIRSRRQATRLTVHCTSSKFVCVIENRAQKLVEVSADSAPLAICRAAIAAAAE